MSSRARLVGLTPRDSFWKMYPYRSNHDAALREDMRSLPHRVRRFSIKYRPPLMNTTFDPVLNLEAIGEYETIMRESGAILSIATASVAAHTTPENGRFEERVHRWFYRKIEQPLRWLDFALGRLTPVQVRQLRHLRQWTPAYDAFIRDLRRMRRYLRSEGNERRVAEHELRIALASDRWEYLLGRLLIKVRVDGRTKYLTLEQAKALLADPSHLVRKHVSEAIAAALRRASKRIAKYYNEILRASWQIRRLRGYPSAETTFLLDNHLTRGVLEAMMAAVLQNKHLLAAYYDLKLSLLRKNDPSKKQRRMYFRDIFAELGKKLPTTYLETQHDFVDAITEYLPTLSALAIEMVTHACTDVKPRRYKHINAWVMMVHPEARPLLFMHFLDHHYSANTFHHEGGHWLHIRKSARRHGVLSFDADDPVAELAAILTELVVRLSTLARERDVEQRRRLRCELIEEAIYNIWQYAGLYRFEQLVHAAYHPRRPLAAEQFMQLMRQAGSEVYGDAFQIDELLEVFWIQKTQLMDPHYAASYPIALINALGILGRLRGKRKKRTAQQVDNLLDKGQTETPAQLLRPFGARIDDPEYNHHCLRLLWQYLKEAQQLVTNDEKGAH